MKLALALGVVSCLVTGAALAQVTAPKDSNAAVQSRGGNDTDVPAKGSNSFTEGQAKGQIEGRGYNNVADLKKDDDGVWRGQAQKAGTSVHVWVDYKGNVGEQR